MTARNSNMALSIRAKREPDNTAVKHFDLFVASSVPSAGLYSRATAQVRYDQFPIGSFGDVTIPFSSFVVGSDTEHYSPSEAPFYNVHQIQMIDFNLNSLNRTHLTFDSLSAVQIPEPSTLGLLGVGGVIQGVILALATGRLSLNRQRAPLRGLHVSRHFLELSQTLNNVSRLLRSPVELRRARRSQIAKGPGSIEQSACSGEVVRAAGFEPATPTV